MAFTANAASTSVSHRSTAVKRAAMEDELGPEGGERRQDGIAVIDPHGVDVGGQDLMVEARPRAFGAQEGATTSPGGDPPRQAVEQVTAQLAVGPGDQDPHRSGASDVPQDPSAIGARARSGSHHSRFAAYHATVSARPCSQSTDGAHPSSLRSLEESST